MSEGNVPALAGPDGKRQPDQIGTHSVKAGGFRIKREAGGFFQAVHKRIELRAAQNRPVFLAAGALITGEFLQQLVKFEFLEQSRQSLAIRLVETEIIVIDRQRQIIHQGYQLPGQSRLIGELTQIFLPLFARHLIDVGQQVFQGAELQDEVPGGLLANPRHPGDVVGAVPCQGLYLHHLVGGAAKPLRDLGQSRHLILHGIKQPHLLVDNLHQVLVAGHHRNLHAPFGKAPRQGSDDVVGFVAGQFQGRHLEGSYNLFDEGNLGLQIFRHGGTVGFVLRIDILAKRRTFGVEHHRQVIGPLLPHHLQEHIGEAEHGVGRHPPGIGQLANGIIGTVNIGRSVDEINTLTLVGHKVPDPEIE